MNLATAAAVESALGRRVIETRPVPGGDINDAVTATLDDGSAVFVKTNPRAADLPGLFAAEAAGLEALRAAAADADGLCVPQVLAVGDDFLVLELIEPAPPPPDYEPQLGRGLAQLHHATRGTRFGWPSCNYLGRWPQPPADAADPAAFWRDARLLPMLAGLTAYPEIVTLGRRLADRLDDLLTGGEPESVLIHGDLWSGNAAADRRGRVWVYDPACACANREVEFGMTRLFGFGPDFEQAYQEVWPLPAGWEQRVEVYRLHHLLSHLWHFGGPYAASSLDLLRRLTG
ncbi:MAG: fructosamine kinase family protein [Planctomycetota bacterium]